MKKLLDKIPLAPLAIFALVMSLAPFVPEPHLWQKLKMLADGSLTKPIDIFDLFWHSWLIILLVLKLSFMTADKKN